MGSERLAEGALLSERYEIQEIVGRGGMGTVYRARDRRLDTMVAVKEMNERDGAPEEHEAALRQFEREARLLAHLSHPNLPHVSDYFIDEGRCYLIMEFVVGETLDARLRQARGTPQPLLAVLNWAVQLADVLTYLHGQTPPIIFRDVKPANIMVTADGTVKLIDFGIARRFQEGATKDTLLYGSPGYSPPEQYGRAQTSPRSDIYAFGATLHHLVTGRDPAPTPFKYPPIRSINPVLPATLETFITRCVEMEESRRYQSAEEARDILLGIRASVAANPSAYMRGQTPSTRPGPLSANRGARSGAAPSSARIVTANRSSADPSRIGRIAAAVIVLVLVLAIGVTAFRQRSRSAQGKPSVGGGTAPPTNNGTGTSSAATGTLRIESTPSGAVIVLDDQEVGTTPQTLEKIAGGKHTLKLIPPPNSGLAEATREVEARPGETRVVDVRLANGGASPNTTDHTPSVTIRRIEAQPVAASPQTPQAGFHFSVAFRVTGAAGKKGMVGVYFYGIDQTTPLNSRVEDSRYQSREGQLMVAETFQADADPADFPDIGLFAPETVFPVPYEQITYRVAIYVDDKMIEQSDVRPLTLSR